jgi:hypothetical protein
MGDGTFAAVSAANIPRLSTGVFTGMFAAVHGRVAPLGRSASPRQEVKPGNAGE